MAISTIITLAGSAALETIAARTLINHPKLGFYCGAVNGAMLIAMRHLFGKAGYDKVGMAIGIWAYLIPVGAMIAKAANDQGEAILRKILDAPTASLLKQKPINAGFVRTSLPKPVNTGFVRNSLI